MGAGLAPACLASLIGSLLSSAGGIGCDSSDGSGTDAGDARDVRDTACPPGQSPCGVGCADLTTDEANCGSCGHACGASESCDEGTCVEPCAAGERLCGTACVDPQTDREHCGGCDHVCPEGQNADRACEAGACVLVCRDGWWDLDEEAGCETACTDDVPGGVDALEGNGADLPEVPAGSFCAAGSVTFRVNDIDDGEVAWMLAAPPTEDRYRLLFALSNTANRNYSMVMTTIHPSLADTLVVKPAVGSCIECDCCGCGDGWCAKEVFRDQCPLLTEGPAGDGSLYTLSWNSAEHWFRFGKSGGDGRLVENIEAPFAFDRYCGAGQGCGMVHWGSDKWANGTVTLVSSSCSESSTEAPAGCP